MLAIILHRMPHVRERRGNQVEDINAPSQEGDMVIFNATIAEFTRFLVAIREKGMSRLDSRSPRSRRRFSSDAIFLYAQWVVGK